ncbi:thioesterase family protein [Pseudomonas hefeiensis]|uniref:Thioesterase family protein n=1 Tax=Pseudomonas hefeiensis TaxID=2738125 RepID=A0ABY9GGX2_9PSED|nr:MULTISPECIES: thioesterase family protein [unclassified Pseudomonas]WLH14792.1 thioesterase family protein [Pseudomonas sp. FP205]WLH97843.1 thioesterase family protein [Pseudomonas sp. FP53]WLI42118.1 thioesterase family protein [Pseudomonas sp. FP821]
MNVPSPSGRPYEKGSVKDEWIDLYGHMNMAYYVMLLDDLGHRILDQFGMGKGYTLEFNCGLFTVEANLKYLREVCAGDPLRVELTPVSFDEKRLVTQVELYHDEQNYLSATMQQTAVNVNLDTRKVCRFGDEARRRLQTTMDAYTSENWSMLARH